MRFDDYSVVVLYGEGGRVGDGERAFKTKLRS